VKVLVVCLLAALVFVPGSLAQVEGNGGPTPYHAPTAAPTGLHAFLLDPEEPAQQYYPRTPSFAWNPVSATGGTYDFELADSRSFTDQSILFSYTKLTIPAIAIAHQLPWMTGVPYALWAHVRWESANGKIVTRWSEPFGFNMRWTDSDYPEQETAPPGLIRWKPIEGATEYQVLYPQLAGSTAFETTTNVADEREFWTFRTPPAEITWRVRAVRYIDDQDLLKNGMPRESFGPWSQLFTSCTMSSKLPSSTYTCPTSMSTTATPEPDGTISDTWDTSVKTPTAYDLTPGFAWTPSVPIHDSFLGSAVSTLPALYRVYIFTDDHCVNQVFAGSVVGSPAFAPRTVGGPFALPQDTATLAEWENPGWPEQTGSEGHSFDATGDLVTPNETPGSQVSTGTTSSSTTTSTNASGSTSSVQPAAVDLWDSGWPNGRYYWTVIPVEVEPYGTQLPPQPGQVATTSESIEYHDTAVPQDQCEAGDGMSFGKVSQPVVTEQGTPFVSGLNSSGREIASASKNPVVHDSPLVAWMPAVGATTYQIQVSRKLYPWVTTWSTTTAATSVVLPLSTKDTGIWWYRVRGIDPSLPSGAQEMSWSTPVRLRISGDSFVVVK